MFFFFCFFILFDPAPQFWIFIVWDTFFLFQLMDGRKAVGGKLEVKVRLRNPIVSNQVEEVTEKWLIIDRI